MYCVMICVSGGSEGEGGGKGHRGWHPFVLLCLGGNEVAQHICIYIYIHIRFVGRVAEGAGGRINIVYVWE